MSGNIGVEAAIRVIKAGAYDYVMKDDLARLRVAVERSLEETSERRRAEKELGRRDAILEAVRFAANRLLGEAVGWEGSIRAVLRRLGESTGVSRVYVWENYVHDDGEPRATHRFEWLAPGVAPGVTDASDGSPATDFPYRDAGFKRLAVKLGRGEPVYGHAREFPESERPLLRDVLGVLSIVLVPIFVEGRWWGFIGFDECEREREWSAAEVGALGAAAGTLSAAIRRKQTEEKLRASEAELRAVFGAMSDVILVLDGEGRYQKVAPTTFSWLYRPPEELIGKTVHDTFPQEQADMILGSIRQALGTRQRVDIEYGLPVGEGEMWFAATISPMTEDLVVAVAGDITERKNNEEALRESEERFRSSFESAAIGMALVRLDGSWLEVNQPFSDIVGYSRQEMANMSFQDITHPDDLDADLESMRRLVAGEIPSYQMEKRYIHKDGHDVWVLLTASLVRDASGEPMYGIGQVQDVTQRKRAEEALARSENRLRTIVETEPECVKVLDMDGCLLEMNPAGLAMMEADSLEQLRGKPVYDVVVPEYHADYRALAQKVLRGGSGTLEFESVGLKGTRSWLETHAVPLRDARGEISGVLGITRNITERKKNEEALRESERLYRAVIEQATENIFLVDVESKRIVESNPAFREAVGYSEEELRSMTIYEIVAADRESVDRNMRQTLREGRTFVGERRYRSKDGTFLNVEASGSITLRNGRPTLCAVAHDVTERARMQALLEERVAAFSRIAANLALDSPVEYTLDVLAKSVVNASPTVACLITLNDEETGEIRLVGSHGVPEGYKAGLQTAYNSEGNHAPSPSREAVRTRRPVLFRDARKNILDNPLRAPIHQFVREAPWDTVYIVPLLSKGEALGTIHFGYPRGQEPTEDEKVFLRAVADQAAVAVENARLFAEARGKAALEERQKLARELHDSVSQALYGIALGSKTAREEFDGNPAEVPELLDYVLSLAEAGMAEMRALIFELRPESLQSEGVVAALQKQAAALEARHGIGVRTDLCEEPEASLEAKEAVYRIVQEALHNIAKHARASSVEVKMGCAPEQITLEISDDGVGFDPDGDFPGHLGLRSMRERAQRVGGKLEVKSAPGQGTRIHAWIPI